MHSPAAAITAKMADAIDCAKWQLAPYVKLGWFKKDRGRDLAIGADYELAWKATRWFEEHSDGHDMMGSYIISALRAVHLSEFWKEITDHTTKDRFAPKKYKKHQEYWEHWAYMIRVWVADKEMPPELKDFMVNFMCSFQEAVQERSRRTSQSPFRARDHKIAATVEYVAQRFGLPARHGDATQSKGLGKSGCSIVQEALAQLGVPMGWRTIQSIYDAEAQSDDLRALREGWKRRQARYSWKEDRRFYEALADLDRARQEGCHSEKLRQLREEFAEQIGAYRGIADQARPCGLNSPKPSA
jgi:hypothetical protein